VPTRPSRRRRLGLGSLFRVKFKLVLTGRLDYVNKPSSKLSQRVLAESKGKTDKQGKRKGWRQQQSKRLPPSDSEQRSESADSDSESQARSAEATGPGPAPPAKTGRVTAGPDKEGWMLSECRIRHAEYWRIWQCLGLQGNLNVTRRGNLLQDSASDESRCRIRPGPSYGCRRMGGVWPIMSGN
jgi:hypothetical protein